MDRGVNSGVTREDIRVIFKASNRKICICSIDNHKIIDIPLVTARGGGG